ncbi:GNAT family N-acetyltransferase [Nocardioides insulae]|uniref:GNAT family N-acetyltransferase n=1 Tax=Nocardioides insulae TaxID=394734 RepID=UPI001B7F88E4|nr:GNAT family N-acetyltransferase [Nocardioides insulae]
MIDPLAPPRLAPGLVLRRTTESDWPQLREFRLENAREHPVSWTASLAATLEFPEDAWRMRARRGDDPELASYAVIESGTGRWVGMMGGQLGDVHGPEPLLVGVYVTPHFRGRGYGVADALLAAILGWARSHGQSVRLWVHEGSEPAIRYYRRHGFTFTGATSPALLDPPGGLLREMVRPLT